ncbi:MAG TPA: PSD1 and planctomycete cytochrome C domain-containing protein [Planctomycetota bacterium]|nr:PSD1 and planctomycete cytochrome C domain-containing protein [Planctomycetota bacterium]
MAARPPSLPVRLSLLALFLAASSFAAEVDFNRDVRPILSQYCFKCHGMDDKTRKGALRLDIREEALKEAKSGEKAIVPGKPDASELIKRIVTTDSEEIMPPPSTKRVLSEKEKSILKDWIASGAKYDAHWAFVRPSEAPVPAVKPESGRVINPIDAHILARLEKENLKQSPEADRYTLARRLYLDLIGIPPTPEEADAFVKDTAPDAYDKLVDKLLAMPQYGERWARRWLDLARYADTNGYEKDRARTIWPYRDWVVRALNADMPFDQFTLKQLAGDMLPNATADDIVATGFHRNTMLNEEGGIDPLEFHYYAVVDRINTTSTAWLGLTVGCCQCHTHKYDPITHTEYFGLFAYLNNTDEPDYSIPDAAREKRREEIETKIAQLTKELPAKWQISSDMDWKKTQPKVTAASGVPASVEADGAVKFSGSAPDKDSYTLTFESGPGAFSRLKLDVLKDGKAGPGRTPHGNFVLSELSISVAPKKTPDAANVLKVAKATADFSQKDFDIAHAIDGKPETGWAIDDGNTKTEMKDRSATFVFEKPVELPEGGLWTVKLDQNYGTQHVIGRLRLSLGAEITDTRPPEARRKEVIESRFAEWEKTEAEKAVAWQVLRPTDIKTNMPHLEIQPDGSLLGSGDVTKSDTYTLKFDAKLQKIAALRLEVLPHESLPNNGPGMCYYEGPKGDFFLSEFHILLGGKRLKVAKATQSFPQDNKNGALQTQDGNMSSGWSVNGAQGKANAAVFVLEQPVDLDGSLELQMMFERHFACPLGHFRISVAGSTGAEARGHPANVEALLTKPAAQRTPEEKDALFQRFLETAPELSAARKEIENLRNSIPKLQTTLALRERPANNPRKTVLYHRGEYTQPKDPVAAGIPAFLPKMPAGAPNNRLGFAQWLLAPENPLTARVTVNRHWQAFFGRGLVRTLEDFGYQGEMPSHPALLDWLALEFVKQGWSVKKFHKLIVTSATYRQSAVVTPELAQRDPANVLLARGPGFRLEAEIIRDSALKSAGLLSAKMGGPGVYPPQPASVTSEGTYGAVNWTASSGEDRYRRSLYTFIKRTAPFAMYNTFDGPTGESCLARREVSNSALQALTLLNDQMFHEAAQQLGREAVKKQGTDAERVTEIFRRCLVRPPEAGEITMLLAFVSKQREAFKTKAENASKLAGAGEGDAAERAAWTALARVVMNLDETVTKR